MKQAIDALIEGGKATGGPPLGPTLGPMGVDISKVIEAINEKTKAFEGMKVPVKVIVDTTTREFEVEVGTPPTSVLIKKELGIEKDSGEAKKNVVGDLPLKIALKVAKMKRDSLLASDVKKAVKEVLGTCVSMGLSVEGKDPREVQKSIAEGIYDEILKE